MIKILKFMINILMLIVGFSFVSCNKIHQKKMDVEKLFHLIKLYDPSKELIQSRNKKAYDIGDSLITFFRETDPNRALKDTNMRKAILFLIETKYLFIVRFSGDKDLMYVYNASNWGGDRTYTQFALNIFNKVHLDENESFDQYINKGKDVTSIDKVIKEGFAYTMTDEEQKKVHEECIKLMPSKCTEWG